MARVVQYHQGKPCKRGHSGLRLTSGGCVECGREKARAKRLADPDATKAALRAWYEKNREKACARASTWYEDNKARAAENKRSWNARNADKKLAASRAWRKANPQKAKASSQKCRAAKVEQYIDGERARCAARRARKRAASGSLTQADIREVSEAQGGRCAYCRAAVRLSIDHIIPLVRGGEHSRRNIQMLCIPCNSSKGAKHPIEFAQSRGLLL